VSDLPAGGLRNRRTSVAAPGSEDSRASGLGADPANGLECAKRKHARTNPGPKGETVLRSESCSFRQVERACRKTSSAARTELLRSEGILLGRGDSLRTSSSLGRCTRVKILGWSSCESYSGIGEESKPMKHGEHKGNSHPSGKTVICALL